MKRIVYVIGQLGVGGSEKQLWHLVNRLDRTRWKPSVVCFDREPAVAAEFESIGCSVKLISRKALGRLAVFRSLWRLLRQIQPDVVQPFAYSWYLAIPAARLAGVPWIVAAERTVPLWKTPLHIFVDRLLLKFTDNAIVNSVEVRDHYGWAGVSSGGQCHVIYNGVDLATFDASAARVANPPCPHLGREPVICAVANAKEDKRLDVLIKAFATVNSAVPESRLWIVGDGPQRAEMESLAADLRLSKRVHFLGFRSDVPSILRQATIGVNSSITEGLCNAVIECMASRLPVVATKVGGNKELVIDNKTGFLVPPEDPGSLARSIIYLLDHPETAIGFGEAGRRLVEERFTVDRMVRETEAVYWKLSGYNGARVLE